MARPSEVRMLVLGLCLTAAALYSPPPAWAQGGGDGEVEGREGAAVATADVEVDGEALFRVRGVTAYPAQARARAIAARIVSVARDSSVKPEDVTVVESDGRVYIAAGERRILMVAEADAEIEQVSPHELAEAILHRVRTAIEAYRAARTREALLASALEAVAATAVAVLAIVLVLAGWRRLDRRMAERIHLRIQAAKVESFKLIRAEDVGQVVRRSLRTLRTIAIAVLVFAYLHLVLGLFPWTRWMNRRLASWVLEPLETMGRAIVAEIPDLIFLAILVMVFRVVLKLLRVFFDAVGRGTLTFANFEPEWAEPTYKIVRLVVIGFGIVVAYPYIPGSDSAAFKGVSLFAGVIFSLGSSSIVSNVIAGYTMTYRRAYRVGDRVRIGDVVGEVTDIRLQVTKIRTPKNEEAIVPNSVVLGSNITNYSSFARTQGLILHTTVGIGYETPWRQVEAMLLMAAERTEGLLREPPPFVLHSQLGDFCVVYELNAYSSEVPRLVRTYTDLHRNILDVFNEYGVQIMTPAYEGDPDVPKVVPRDQWHLAPAAREEDAGQAPPLPEPVG